MAGRRAIKLLQKSINRRNRRRRMIVLLQYIMYRRRMMLSMCLANLLLISRLNAKPARQRSCRRFQRNNGWWNLVWNNYSDKRFCRTFRISKGSFSFILSRIRHVLERDTINEQPISPECRLGICLYRLARGDYYYTIAEMVGLGVATVCSIVSEVPQAIIDHLWQDCVKQHMPQTQSDFENKILDMEELWQFPFCWAAVDGCHISIKCPHGGLKACKEYHNFNNFYSVVLMAMVDSKYRFVWGSCGFPGNSHDSIIFQSTESWKDIQDNDLIQNIGQQVGKSIIPPLILGDSAFPLQPWLMKPYTNAVLTPEQRNFNYRLSRARMVTEGAYGQLKGRWRALLRKSESSAAEVKKAALACMVLHNICIDKGESLSKKLDLSHDPNSNERRDRTTIRNLLEMRSCNKINDSSSQANKIRDTLCAKLWKEKQDSQT